MASIQVGIHGVVLNLQSAQLQWSTHLQGTNTASTPPNLQVRPAPQLGCSNKGIQMV